MENKQVRWKKNSKNKYYDNQKGKQEEASPMEDHSTSASPHSQNGILLVFCNILVFARPVRSCPFLSTPVQSINAATDRER